LVEVDPHHEIRPCARSFFRVPAAEVLSDSIATEVTEARPSVAATTTSVG
jgi:hypothetical protein